MRDAIIGKLSRYLFELPASECVVVYVLAEIRKLLERDGKQGSFGRLSFFCNWALHASLSLGAARAILREIDEGIVRNELDVALYRTVTFEQFKKDLGAFLKNAELPELWTTNGWPSFLENYCSIIQDCPLEISDRPPHNEMAQRSELKHVRRLDLTTSRSELEGEAVVEASWDVRYRDEKVPAKSVTIYLWRTGFPSLHHWGQV